MRVRKKKADLLQPAPSIFYPKILGRQTNPVLSRVRFSFKLQANLIPPAVLLATPGDACKYVPERTIGITGHVNQNPLTCVVPLVGQCTHAAMRHIERLKMVKHTTLVAIHLRAANEHPKIVTFMLAAVFRRARIRLR